MGGIHAASDRPRRVAQFATEYHAFLGLGPIGQCCHKTAFAVHCHDILTSIAINCRQSCTKHIQSATLGGCAQSPVESLEEVEPTESWVVASCARAKEQANFGQSGEKRCQK